MKLFKKFFHRLSHWFGTYPADCEYRTMPDGTVTWHMWCTVCGKGCCDDHLVIWDGDSCWNCGSFDKYAYKTSFFKCDICTAPRFPAPKPVINE